MSAVGPSALVMISPRYLPRPSCVMPRCTVTPVCGTSQKLIVLFWPLTIACERSLPTFSRVDVEGGDELDVADVVAAEVDVHQARDEVVVVGVAVVVDALHERRGAVADAHDGDADAAILGAAVAVAVAVAGHACSLDMRSRSAS